MDNDRGHTTAIILDINENKIQLRRRRCRLGAGSDFDLHLRLKSNSADASELTTATLARLEQIVLAERERFGNSFSNCVFVLGNENDPFLCGKNRIDLALRTVEFLSQQTDAFLHIQTRSPLAILALPLLRQLASRTCITMGIETLNDTLARRLTPWLPRPSERVTAARAMHSLGISTLIQAAPLGLESESPRYARCINEISNYVYPVEWNKLQRSTHYKVDESANNLRRHISDYKLVRSITEAWSQIDARVPTTASEAA